MSLDSLRLFDPESQRSSESLEEAQILPVKEILFFPEFIRLAGEKLAATFPGQLSQKDSAQEVLEKVQQGIPFPGVEFYLPFFYPSLETFFDFVPARTVLFLDDSAELEEGLTRFWEEAEEAWQTALTRDEIWPSPGELFLSRRGIARNGAVFIRGLPSRDAGGGRGRTPVPAGDGIE